MKKIIALVFLSILLTACVNTTTPPQQTMPTLPAVLPTRTRIPTRTPVPIIFTGCVDNTLRVRSGPGTDNEIIGRLKPQNIDENVEGENFKFTLPACVSVVGRNQDTSWVMVSYEGQTGWVFANYINIVGDVDHLAIIDGNRILQVPTVFAPLATESSSSGSGGTAPCSCGGNLYNCADFSSHADAQACYNYCLSVGRGDIHWLDDDNDGSACESLP